MKSYYSKGFILITGLVLALVASACSLNTIKSGPSTAPAGETDVKVSSSDTAKPQTTIKVYISSDAINNEMEKKSMIHLRPRLELK